MSRIPLITVAGLGALALAACGSSSSTGASAGTGGTAPASSPTSSGTGLSVASSDLGKVVVDGGRTVYVFDTDKQGSGTSSCTGGCLAEWPPVEGSTQVKGVTGKVGTIPAADGGEQLTLDGWPLYYFAGDSGAGDTAGQGIDGTWWAVAPSGDKITSGGATSSDDDNGDDNGDATGGGAGGGGAYSYRALPRFDHRHGDDHGHHRERGDDHGHHRERGDDRGHHRERGDDRGHHRERGDDRGHHRERGDR